MFWCILGYGPSSPEYRGHSQGPERVAAVVEWRCAAGASHLAGGRATAVGERHQRATDFGILPFDSTGHSQGRPSLSNRGPRRALYEKQRPGAASLLEGSQKQRIIAMVC